ncbi:hypothetical protein RM553_10015 [Zunongwangia sp. F363]|uniref:Uncharacterized protein n=1 Tax=Autumnicola tepida TaxID=3075595 RepID=A0ABU3C9Z6_9FLAO|nr:hypothetical protein [Zunongwangia sp. F363]MDT0643163.1 hypothetical protein [Zunongwangia sp. F363]
MKAKILLLSLFVLSFSSCNAQENKEKESDLLSQNEEQELEPKGNWKVNKQFDENGNLISYDSTYVYSYSTMTGDTIQNAGMEEMLQQFRQVFGRRGMNVPSDMFGSFFSDTLKGEDDILKDDFFSRQMSRGFQEQVKQIDSLHRQLLKEHYPQLFYDNREKMVPKASGTGTI